MTRIALFPVDDDGMPVVDESITASAARVIEIDADTADWLANMLYERVHGRRETRP